MKTKSNAVILARVSSKAQEDEGYSLDSQLKLLRNYCDNKKLNIVKEFRVSETASKYERRKTFKEMLEYIRKNRITHLAAEKTDRFTRNFSDAVAIDHWLEHNDKRKLHMVKEGLMLHKNSKSDEKLMWSIYRTFALQKKSPCIKAWLQPRFSVGG